MKYLVALLLLLPTFAQACDCGLVENFCEYADNYFEWTEGQTVVARARLKNFRTPDVNGNLPLFDFVLTEIISGEYSGSSTVSLLGQDGGNCNGPLEDIFVGGEYIIFFPKSDRFSSAYGIQPGDFTNPFPIHDLPGCGPATLAISSNRVSGPITAGINSLSYEQLVLQVRECVGEEYTFDNPALSQPIDLEIFPNPASESFTICLPATPIYDISLYDLSGRLISRENLDGTPIEQHNVNVNQLPAGVYHLVMETDGARIKERVVVQ